jgi:hypothetical protein
MLTMIEGLHFIGLLLTMIIFHEFGHWLVLRFKASWYHFDVTRKYWGFRYELKNKESTPELIAVYFWAVFLGFVPMFIFPIPVFWNSGNLLLILYVAGCWFDIKQIDAIIKNEIIKKRSERK